MFPRERYCNTSKIIPRNKWRKLPSVVDHDRVHGPRKGPWSVDLPARVETLDPLKGPLDPRPKWISQTTSRSVFFHTGRGWVRGSLGSRPVNPDALDYMPKWRPQTSSWSVVLHIDHGNSYAVRSPIFYSIIRSPPTSQSVVPHDLSRWLLLVCYFKSGYFGIFLLHQAFKPCCFNHKFYGSISFRFET